MSSLLTEFTRLYAPDPADEAVGTRLIDGRGQTRALVLELGGPADWALLGPVWRGVQADLGLPAPAIAASGTDGLQLWFSLAEALPLAEGRALLEALRRHYLPGLPLRRVRLWPQADGQHARPVPQPMADSGNWSAFLAPDLAPLFAETPWLDIPPGDEGQAQLLAGGKSIQPTQRAAALAQLQADTPSAAPPAPAPTAHRLSAPSAGWTDPRAFLLAVMNDDTAPLALRIEAAKGLLAHAPSAP